MKHLKTFEEKSPKEPKAPSIFGDNPIKFKKLQYCQKCKKMQLHMNDRCMVCRKRWEDERDRKAKFSINPEKIE
jgi:hypothetical protein